MNLEANPPEKERHLLDFRKTISERFPAATPIRFSENNTRAFPGVSGFTFEHDLPAALERATEIPSLLKSPIKRR
jgi:hypothetical protein